MSEWIINEWTNELHKQLMIFIILSTYYYSWVIHFLLSCDHLSTLSRCNFWLRASGPRCLVVFLCTRVLRTINQSSSHVFPLNNCSSINLFTANTHFLDWLRREDWHPSFHHLQLAHNVTDDRYLEAGECSSLNKLVHPQLSFSKIVSQLHARSILFHCLSFFPTLSLVLSRAGTHLEHSQFYWAAAAAAAEAAVEPVHL